MKPLSDQQLKALRLLATGLVQKQIAAELNLSYGTTKVHIQKVLAKLHAENATHAVAIGFRKGLLK
jgi:DNA-binding NarL/FixJ family response regulator